MARHAVWMADAGIPWLGTADSGNKDRPTISMPRARPAATASAAGITDRVGLYRFKMSRPGLTCGFGGWVQAARWYSLITPPSTFRRRTGLPSATTTRSS